MYALFGLLALAAFCIALGVAYRLSCVVFLLGFTYAHVCDKANYLNHYYLISLVSLLLVLVPLDRELSLRVWRAPTSDGRTCARGCSGSCAFKSASSTSSAASASSARIGCCAQSRCASGCAADAELPLLRPLRRASAGSRSRSAGAACSSICQSCRSCSGARAACPPTPRW